MRHIPLERFVQILTLVSFALSCWTLNRALRPRVDCVTSPVLREVVIENQHVTNCAFESRLRIGGPVLSPVALRRLRLIENTFGAERWFRREPRAVITVDEINPRGFALVPGGARLGATWIDDVRQLRRAVAMAVLNGSPTYSKLTPFTIETLADFILLSSRSQTAPPGVGFATAAPTLAAYCASPLRSLAHEAPCRAGAAAVDHDANAWGFQPALSGVLARTFGALSLREQLRVVARVKAGVALPFTSAPVSTAAADLKTWFSATTEAWAGALQMLTDVAAGQALIAAREALDVDAPTHWGLTVDLRHTPQWREILNQLLARAKFRPGERALLFTPEGEVALPSGLPAYWAAADVDSEKHVMIACHWPAARAAVAVRARQFFARQTCGTLDGTFWD